jgi:multimeric flavodoxin WrbA
MKILLLNGSPRTDGNTSILLDQTKNGVEEIGMACELLQLGKLEIKPCDACLVCLKPGHEGTCHIQDDMQQLYKALKECEGIVFATPVYMWNMTSQMLALVQRTFAVLDTEPPVIRGKVAGLIVTAARRGIQNVVNTFNMYFIANQMTAIDPVYGYGSEKGEIRSDTHAMKSAFELGRLTALMLKEGKKADFPGEYRNRFLFSHVCEKYNIPLAPSVQDSNSKGG